VVILHCGEGSLDLKTGSVLARRVGGMPTPQAKGISDAVSPQRLSSESMSGCSGTAGGVGGEAIAAKVAACLRSPSAAQMHFRRMRGWRNRGSTLAQTLQFKFGGGLFKEILGATECCGLQ
jgi:hypothetical protein